ncbi:MAG TPA: YXWGXW repeat-containing protein [Candidatus Saccharimonadales bacterium]|nr:YXWGXW repeat-containing protein [Candidatus Saccharimonadales bacterium]
MKSKWLFGAILGAAVVVPASAQISIYFRSGPPPVRYEQQYDAPGPGYTWIDGYWIQQGRHYQWVGGHWQQPPFEGARWNHPHYDHERRGWKMHEGHWDHEDHDHDNHGHGGDDRQR